MNRFWENAASIAKTAEQSWQCDATDSPLTILIGPSGEIHMIADSDWPLDSLQIEHGAQMAYRITRQETKVRIEGRAGSQTCLFEAGKPDGVARLLLPPQRNYELLE